MAETGATTPVIGRRSIGWVAGAAVAGAMSTFAITVIAARVLTRGDDASAYNEFLVFWGLLFGVFGVVVGLANEGARAVGEARRTGVSGARMIEVAGVVGLILAVAVVATGRVWSPRLLPGTDPLGPVMIGIGVLAYAVFQTLLGACSGLHAWRAFSVLQIGDAVARLGLVAGVGLAGWGLAGLEGASAGASLVLMLTLFHPVVRRAATARGDRPLAALLRTSMLAMVSSTSTAVLVVAYPVLVRSARPDVDPTVMAAHLTAVSLTRSTIMIPMFALQGVAVAAFLGSGGSLRPLVKPLLAVGACVAVGAPLAAWVGPWFLHVAYGRALDVAALTFGLLIAAAGVLATLTLTGAAALASGRHAGFAGGWVTAAIASTVLLLLPVGLPAAVSISLIAGPLLGIGVHLVTLRSARRRLQAGSS